MEIIIYMDRTLFYSSASMYQYSFVEGKITSNDK